MNSRNKVIYLVIIILAGVGWLKTIKIASQKIKKLEKQVEKNKQYYNLYDHWIEAKNNGAVLDNYFKKNEYYNIAIYGLGDVGMQFAREMNSSSNVTVKYVMDKNICADKAIFPRLEINDDLPVVDAIIVTPIFAFDSIKKELENYVSCPIICIEDVIYDL